MSYVLDIVKSTLDFEIKHYIKYCENFGISFKEIGKVEEG